MSNNINNKKNNHINNIMLIIFIAIIITMILRITYAYLELNNSNTAEGTAGCFNVSYSAQEINSSNLESTTNYLDGAQTTVTLSKASDCEIYTKADININTNTTTTAPISDGALKYKIYNGSNLISEGSITNTGKTTLAENITLTTTATNYKIYLWIDSALSQGSYDLTTYSGYIYAESTQTSTIQE